VRFIVRANLVANWLLLLLFGLALILKGELILFVFILNKLSNPHLIIKCHRLVHAVRECVREDIWRATNLLLSNTLILLLINIMIILIMMPMMMVLVFMVLPFRCLLLRFGSPYLLRLLFLTIKCVIELDSVRVFFFLHFLQWTLINSSIP
jgi:hypothetical protein